ncbi:hypothetical protein SUGI_0237990 [Cryptomeria japonica]|nr:hypothetical protein SUGI_0237990 [Cryptomeria japonica]
MTIDVTGESRISDSYKMRVLNEALEGLEMVGPQSFMENGSVLQASVLKKLESSFMSVVENSVAINLHGEKSSEKEDLVLTLDLRAVKLINIIAEKLNTFGRDWLVMLKKTVKVLVSFERDLYYKIFETFGEKDLEKKLVHSACQVLRDFNGKIVEDAGISIDGTAPRIASYVVNYLKLMVTEYGKVMTRALEMEDSTSLAQNVSLVIDSLELNLRTRAKGYNETALADLFLMNSYWYIFKRARDSELGSVLGEPWLKQRRQLVNQHVLSYEKEKWEPLLKHLNINGLVMSTGGRGGPRDLFK